jgi:chemotaxis protein CheD
MTADQTVYVAQGEFQTSNQPNVVFSTVLGSCVSACIWDPDLAIGGLNHFLLAQTSETDRSGSSRYGVHAMEMLINDLLKKGARRKALQAKLFGGAMMASNLGDIGTNNAKFARSFLAAEDIPCLAESLGGTNARRIIFRPTTGHVRQLIVESDDFIEKIEKVVPPPKPDAQAFLF